MVVEANTIYPSYLARIPLSEGSMLAKPTAFHVMVKPRGAICNLNCSYCYFLKKEHLYPESDFRMSEELLAEYTRQYIAAQTSREVTFAWQGGEPTLMGLDFYRKAIEFQKQFSRPGMQIQNAFQTNGILLDETWCQFFKEHNFLVGLSLDGPEAMHDAYRLDKGDQPTFDRVMKALRLLKKYRVDFNILSCVHAANADHGLEVYRFLRDEAGARYIQFIPIVERHNETGNQQGSRVTERSVTGRQYGEFLTAVFDEWLRRDVGRVYVQLFDVALGVWLGHRASLCVFDETCGAALALEHNGDLYSCDHFVEPDYYLGNINQEKLIDLVAGPLQASFGEAKRSTLPKYCRRCEVRFMCNGGCPKNRILKTPDGEPGLNYLCEGYRAFFNYIDQPMKMMAMLINLQRPPADIMRLIDQIPAPEIPSALGHLPLRKKKSHRSRRSGKAG
jgi:uncharacterized protein